MLDHRFIDENGVATPIAKLPTEEVARLLVDEIEISDTEGTSITVDDVRRRLAIELEIRRQGLR